MYTSNRSSYKQSAKIIVFAIVVSLGLFIGNVKAYVVNLSGNVSIPEQIYPVVGTITYDGTLYNINRFVRSGLDLTLPSSGETTDSYLSAIHMSSMYCGESSTNQTWCGLGGNMQITEGTVPPFYIKFTPTSDYSPTGTLNFAGTNFDISNYSYSSQNFTDYQREIEYNANMAETFLNSFTGVGGQVIQIIPQLLALAIGIFASLYALKFVKGLFFAYIYNPPIK